MKKLRGSSSRARSKIARGFFPMAFAAIDEAGVKEYIGIVRQGASGDSQFTAGPCVVAKAIVVVSGQREVSFARIRLKAQRGSTAALARSRRAGCGRGPVK